MADFWLSFLGGLASGIALFALTVFIRRLIRRRSQGKAMLELNMKELRPFIPIAVGLVLLLLGIFGGQRAKDYAFLLVPFGAVMLIVGAIWAS